MTSRLLLAALLLLVGACGDAVADVRLPAVFGDGMVLQRGRPIPVWGSTAPHGRVRVQLGAAETETTAGADGRWRVELPALEAGGPYSLTVSGGNELRFQDVLIGDVWICSGQSNMSWPVKDSLDGAAEVAAAEHPSIRLFTVAKAARAEPVDDVRGTWQVCSPASAAEFSAVGYFFGRELQRELDVPVGLIVTAWMGSPAESWTPESVVRAEPALDGLWAWWQQRIEAFDPASIQEYERLLIEWTEAAAEAERNATAPPTKPRTPRDPSTNYNCPGRIWNGMVAPLLPMSVRGVIWYQGELNATKAAQYRVLFPLLVRAWRDGWGDDELPFLFVQLAAFGFQPPGQTAPSGGPSVFAELREAQLMTHRALPRTGMAVTIDVGDPVDPHPANKQAVGARLALWARSIVYGHDVVCSGPLYAAAETKDGGVRITFDHAAGLRTSDGKPPAGFAVAGEDGVFVAGSARIDGDGVVVTRPGGGDVAFVRYAWSDAPAESLNLMNAAGLPASPFRTDDLPLVTAGRE